MAQGGEWTYGRTDGQTNVRKISPFYRTLSPIRAAALPPPMKTKGKVEQGKGTADHLMTLGYLFFILLHYQFSPFLCTTKSTVGSKPLLFCKNSLFSFVKQIHRLLQTPSFFLTFLLVT